jgi:hypothetical protein
MLAIAGRYLAMAPTSVGVSTFHEPTPARSLLEPWVLAGLFGLVALAVRCLRVLRAGRAEAGHWIWAAAAYAPVSQIFPFLYPLGDRYLYFVLPGLLGGAFLWGADVVGRRLPRLARERSLRLGAAAAGAVLCVVFASLSYGRADVWRSELSAALDAARHYPDGTSATYFVARRAAQSGDPDAALAALDRLAGRGFDGFLSVPSDPALLPLQADPRFAEVVGRMAENWISHVLPRGELTQPELRMLALAYRVRGDDRAALESYRRALAAGGPLDETVAAELRALEAGNP